jgi:hypothetical protein
MKGDLITTIENTYCAVLHQFRKWWVWISFSKLPMKNSKRFCNRWKRFWKPTYCGRYTGKY